jgi:molybdopterin converting factor small subunit
MWKGDLYLVIEAPLLSVYCVVFFGLRRTQALSRASGVSSEAKSVVSELQARLSKEMEEREVESAMYNARLYENEKQQGDWYVERRMLEKRIIEQDEEVRPGCWTL